MDLYQYSNHEYFYKSIFLREIKSKEGYSLTLEEYGKSNFRFLNLYQSMLFISNGADMKGTYVTINKHGEHNMVYVFEKNKQNEELLTKFRNRELTWGDNVIKFE